MGNRLQVHELSECDRRVSQIISLCWVVSLPSSWPHPGLRQFQLGLCQRVAIVCSSEMQAAKGRFVVQSLVKCGILFVLAALLNDFLQGFGLEILKVVRLVKDQLCFCRPFCLP